MLYWARAVFFIQYTLIASLILICFYSASHSFASAYKNAMNSNQPKLKVAARPKDVHKSVGQNVPKHFNSSTIKPMPIAPMVLSFQTTKGDDYKKDESSSELTGFSSNPKNPFSPFGVHGNNYSLYDINSPSGQFGKL